MPRGRKKGTKLSDEHKQRVREGLRKHFETNTVWNAGTRRPKGRTPEEVAKGRELRLLAVTKAARTRRLKTIESYLDRVRDSWSNGIFSTENGVDYLQMTHQCGSSVKVQLQTIRKWSFADGLCKKCHPVFSGTSRSEGELLDWVRSIEPSALHRQQVIGHEVDILVPDLKLAIEYDGLYWHSELAGYPIRKHLDKTEACLSVGIRLIHVFEDEWVHQQGIVKSRISALLGSSTRIFARKLRVRTVDQKTCTEFLNRTHLQGSVPASVRLGLFLDDRLCAVMTFGKPRFRRDHEWELLRYAGELNTTVVGGASKLLAAFRSTHPGKIISYADRRYSSGEMYRQLGFKELDASSPGYFYFKGDLRQNRQTFQKHKLAGKLETFDPALSEAENMFMNGWNRIWDCGNLVFSL
jgi:very-short-patch-repair endonuclease